MSVTDAPTVDDAPESDAAPMRGGSQLSDFLNTKTLSDEVERNAAINRATTRPYRRYQKRVILKAGVPNAQATRQLTSNICGVVARLPFVPDDKDVVETRGTTKITEFDLQVERIATAAEVALESEMVWTSAARRLARAALELRRTDPEGKKCKATDGLQGAWVTDQLVDDAAALDS